MIVGGVAKETSRQKEKPHQSCGGMRTLSNLSNAMAVPMLCGSVNQ